MPAWVAGTIMHRPTASLPAPLAPPLALLWPLVSPRLLKGQAAPGGSPRTTLYFMRAASTVACSSGAC